MYVFTVVFLLSCPSSLTVGLTQPMLTSTSTLLVVQTQQFVGGLYSKALTAKP